MAESKPAFEYDFKFSTKRDLNGPFQPCKALTIFTLVLVAIALPLIELSNYIGTTSIEIPTYGWLIYVLVFNSIMLLIGSKAVASSIAYPFGNSWFNSNFARQNNERFGLEFLRCL